MHGQSDQESSDAPQVKSSEKKSRIRNLLQAIYPADEVREYFPTFPYRREGGETGMKFKLPIGGGKERSNGSISAQPLPDVPINDEHRQAVVATWAMGRTPIDAVEDGIIRQFKGLDAGQLSSMVEDVEAKRKQALERARLRVGLTNVAAAPNRGEGEVVVTDGGK